MGRWILVSLFLAACSGGTESATDDAADASQEVDEDGIPVTPPDVAAPPEDAEKTESGLASRVLKAGTGTEHPGPKSKVTAHYTGWRAEDGERFDSSYERGEPTSFALTSVIPGWTEGLQLMVVGEKRRFWIPEELAYKGRPNKPAGMLVFDVELESFENPPEPPENLEAPADAKTTESGIQYVVLEPGTGTENPTLDDAVQFAFAGWTAEGNPIQSSFNARSTPRARVQDLIPSWREFTQTMVEGQKIVAWVPPGIDKIPGAPEGTTIFEFKLLKLEKPLPAPDDVATPPEDATKTENGVAVKILEKGEGTDKVKSTDVVRMHFTMWTAADGKMYDSTYQSGRPATVPMTRVPVRGWAEGVQQLAAGDKARIWIPEDMAFPAQAPQAPKGAITMDVEVLEILTPPKPRLPPTPPGSSQAPGGKPPVPPAAPE